MADTWGIVKQLLTAPDMQQKQLSKDMGKYISLLQPNYSSIFSFLMNRGLEMPTIAQEFDWLEDEHIPFKTAVDHDTDDYDKDTVEIVVDENTTKYFVKGDRVYNDTTGEVYLVTDIDHTTHTLTVTRGYGTDNMCSIPHESVLLNIHNTNALGADTVESRMTKAKRLFNYVQIFKKTADIDKSTAKHGLDVLANERMRQITLRGQEHVAGIERAFLFGRRKADDDTYDKRAYNTGGLFQFIQSKVTTDDNGTLTETEFMDWLEDLFEYGSNEKMVFVGDIISAALAKWYKNDLQVDPNFLQLGLSVAKVVTPSGKIAYVKHHEAFTRTSQSLRGTALGLDMSHVKIRTYRPTVLNMGIQSPSADKYLDEWLTEIGLQVGQEKHHAVLKGVTAYT